MWYFVGCLTGINTPLFDVAIIQPPVWTAHQVVYQAAG
jgi:hypothetical protein